MLCLPSPNSLTEPTLLARSAESALLGLAVIVASSVGLLVRE